MMMRGRRLLLLLTLSLLFTVLDQIIEIFEFTGHIAVGRFVGG